jgi:hypothetical protein
VAWSGPGRPQRSTRTPLAAPSGPRHQAGHRATAIRADDRFPVAQDP